MLISDLVQPNCCTREAQHLNVCRLHLCLFSSVPLSLNQPTIGALKPSYRSSHLTRFYTRSNLLVNAFFFFGLLTRSARKHLHSLYQLPLTPQSTVLWIYPNTLAHILT